MLSRVKDFLLSHPFWAVLLGACALYAPAIPIPFRDPDHLVYFANLGSEHSLLSVLKHFDYSFSRLYWKGDDFLFRPLLFVLQGLESYFFSYRYVYWNFTNLALHLAVLWALYRLLITVMPAKIWAAFFCALFTFSIAPRGLVINPHLGGYLAGFFCFFEALRYIYRMLQASALDLSDLRKYTLMSVLSVFFYELTLPFLAAAAIPLIVACRRDLKAKHLLYLLLPFLLYGAAYLPHALAVKRLLYASSLEAPSLFSLENLAAVPADSHYLVREFIREVFPNSRNAKLLFAAVFTVFFLPAFRPVKPVRFTVRFYPFVLMGIYTAGLALFRGTFMRDYYQYLFNALFVLAVYSQLNFLKLGILRKKLALSFLAAVILWNAWHTWVLNLQLFEGYKDPHRYFRQISRFIAAHQKEPGFSFKIENPDKELDMVCELKPGYPDEDAPVTSKWFSEILYARYYDKTQPRYTLQWTGKNFINE